MISASRAAIRCVWSSELREEIVVVDGTLESDARLGRDSLLCVGARLTGDVRSTKIGEEEVARRAGRLDIGIVELEAGFHCLPRAL